MKNKVLLVLHLPEPVHGSSIVGKCIKDSVRINTEFNSRYINLGTSKSIEEIGKNPFGKIIVYFKIILNTLHQLLIFKPDLFYLAITAKGIGFYKDLIIVFLAKLFGVKLVLHFHNKGVQANSHKKIDDFLYRFAFNKAKVILLTKYLYSDIEKYVSKEDVFYCPNGIPNIDMGTLENKSIENEIQLLFLSNLIVSKGVFVLLEALKILLDKNINFKCNFVGGEGDISELDFNNYVISLGLENNVKYLGGKYNEDKNKVFLESGIFVHPSYEDCLPLVLLEAMQYSLPIVSTFQGGIPDVVIQDVTGFLVVQKDVEALANKLEILITKPEIRKKMGIAGRVRYEKEFTLDQFEKNMTQILKTII